MTGASLLIGLSLCLQVPPPASARADDHGGPLRAEHRALIDGETAKLGALTDRLAKAGKAAEEKRARALVEPSPPTDGSTRFVPLPEVVRPASKKGESAGVGAEAQAIRSATAKALFDLARRAGAPGPKRQLALADACLRGVLDREPDHAEARRLLGFLPHQGGWATPHAVEMLRQKKVLDPTFGWIDADWLPHLKRGELPGKVVGDKPKEWLPAAKADALRAEWSHAWQIRTLPHFSVRTNVPLSEAIAFGRRLEALHDLFGSLFADAIGPARLPLAQRIADPRLKPQPTRRKHEVWYFASKKEYVDFFRKIGEDESKSLGYYMPPWDAKQRKMPPRSYFYKDAANQIAEEATLYHEASHQLLFESAGDTKFPWNVGQYWVWEGLGTYFETLTPQPDGSLRIGGPVGQRLARAREFAIDLNRFVPTGRLVAMEMDQFRDWDDVYVHYAESMALAVFLMNGRGGRYRPAFLDYVEDAYRGRFARGADAPTLAERLGVETDELDAQLLEYLKERVRPASSGSGGRAVIDAADSGR